MPVRKYKCHKCSYVCRAFDRKSGLEPLCDRCLIERKTDVRMARIIGAPQAKFMEKIDSNKNRSNMKDQQKMLLERSRVHTRDQAADDLIQANEEEVATKNQWLVKNSDGSLRKRKGIDDK